MMEVSLADLQQTLLQERAETKRRLELLQEQSRLALKGLAQQLHLQARESRTALAQQAELLERVADKLGVGTLPLPSAASGLRPRPKARLEQPRLWCGKETETDVGELIISQQQETEGAGTKRTAAAAAGRPTVPPAELPPSQDAWEATSEPGSPIDVGNFNARFYSEASGSQVELPVKSVSNRSTTRRISVMDMGEDGAPNMEADLSAIQRALGFKKEDIMRPPDSSVAISAKAKFRRALEKGFAEWVMTHSYYENVFGTIIIVNALCIGLEADYRARLRLQRCRTTWSSVNFAFTVLFALELLLRFGILRCKIWRGPEKYWNMFDLTIVVAAVIEEGRNFVSDCDTGSTNLNFKALRILRVVRLVRIVRVVRQMTIFKDLRLMVHSAMNCMIPLGCILLVLLVVMWVFSVYFLDVTTDFISDQLMENGAAFTNTTAYGQLTNYYGDLLTALITLFESVTGGINWDEAAKALTLSGLYTPMGIFFFFIALTMLALLNIVTGVFVENAVKNANHDRDLMIQETLQNRKEFMQDALAVFKEADTDDDEKLTWPEFQEHLLDPRVQAFLNVIEISGIEARRLFRLLDLDDSGTVSAEEFVTGCMCLRGVAKTMDVAALILEHQQAARRWKELMETLMRRLELLDVWLGIEPKEACAEGEPSDLCGVERPAQGINGS